MYNKIELVKVKWIDAATGLILWGRKYTQDDLAQVEVAWKNLMEEHGFTRRKVHSHEAFHKYMEDEEHGYLVWHHVWRCQFAK
jgi:trans-aconitate methyltransferase